MKKDEHQVRAIIVFGDMSGFGGFTQRITHPDTEFKPFIHEYDNLIDEFEEQTGYFLKRLGDGFMCVVDYPESSRFRVVDLVNAIWDLTKRINQLISRKRTPRPDGFRSRMVCGYVWKSDRSDKRRDYLGYHVNLCEKILHVSKKDVLVCHESIREIVPKKSGFVFKKLTQIEALTDGIYKTDIDSLWTLTKRK